MGFVSTRTFPELPGWTFDIDEVSRGQYRVRARDVDGRSVDHNGSDLEVLLDDVRKVAFDMRSKIPDR